MITGSLVPVTVVGGYLGAGKTTLVNRLLTAEHGQRLAVLVNDFGEINVDIDLIVDHDGLTISLENGCVCCSIADSLGESLDRVLALDPLPDRIVIEASGVADPAKVAAYGQGWPGCRLDGVVVLADAETIRRRAGDPFVGELVVRQLRNADLVLVTKTDLAGPAASGQALDWIESTTRAPVILLTAAVLPQVFDLVEPGASNGLRPDGAPPDARRADEIFESSVHVFDRPIRRDELDAFFENLPGTVVRAKGTVLLDAGAGRPGPWVVQRVGSRLTITACDGDSPSRGTSQLAVTRLRPRPR